LGGSEGRQNCTAPIFMHSWEVPKTVHTRGAAISIDVNSFSRFHVFAVLPVRGLM